MAGGTTPSCRSEHRTERAPLNGARLHLSGFKHKTDGEGSVAGFNGTFRLAHAMAKVLFNDLRANLAETPSRLDAHSEPVFMAWRARPTSVLMKMPQYEALVKVSWVSTRAKHTLDPAAR